MPNRNRFYWEIDQENRSKRESIIWSFLILFAFIASMAFCLYAPTNKKIMAPIEGFQAQFKTT